MPKILDEAKKLLQPKVATLPVKPVGLGGASSGAQLLEDVKAPPVYPNQVYKEAAANLKGNPEAAAQAMGNRLGGEAAASYGKQVAGRVLRAGGGLYGGEQVGEAAMGNQGGIPGAALGGAVMAGAPGAAALGGLATLLYPSPTVTGDQENAEIARLSKGARGFGVPAPEVSTRGKGTTLGVVSPTGTGVISPAVAGQGEAGSYPNALWRAPVGTFNGREITREESAKLADRLPIAPSASDAAGKTVAAPAGFYKNAGENYESDRGEAIMDAARSGAIKPDQALRMYNNEPAAPAPVATLGEAAPQESAYAREVQQSNAMRDLWGIENEASRRGANPKRIAAMLEAHSMNPLYGGGVGGARAAAAAAIPPRGESFADRLALAQLANQGREGLEEKRFAHLKELEGQREAGRASEQETKAGVKPAAEEQKAEEELISGFKANPVIASAAYTQLKARFGGPVARTMMEQIPPNASGAEISQAVAAKLQAMKGG
jgi:hypothetical protein